MEVRHRIECRAVVALGLTEIVRAEPQQRRFERRGNRLVLVPVGAEELLDRALTGAALHRRAERLALAAGEHAGNALGELFVEPGAEAGDRRQRREGLHARELGRELVDDALDQEAAEADAGKAALRV